MSSSAYGAKLQRLSPVKIYFGRGAVSELPAILRERRSKQCTWVASRGFVRSNKDVFRAMLSKAEKNGQIQVLIPRELPITFEWLDTTVRSINPTTDCFVGIGGGTVMDATKALATMFDTQKSIRRLLADSSSASRKSTLVLVPTTVATGSETSKGAVLIDTSTGKRVNLKGPFSLADFAIVDPPLQSQSRRYLRHAVFDIFSHAVEGFFSRKADVKTEAASVCTIQTIVEMLPRIKSGRITFKDREMLAYLGSLMGVTLQRASTCLPHRLSYALPKELQYTLSHPEATALFYPGWLRAIETSAEQKVQDLNRLLGAPALPLILKVRTELGLTKEFRNLHLGRAAVPSMLRRCTGNLSDDPAYVDTRTLRGILQA